MLFLSAKVAHLGKLPQGRPEASRRVLKMLEQHDAEGFGACTNTGACSAVCPKEISLANIAYLNRQYISATMASDETLAPIIEKGGG